MLAGLEDVTNVEESLTRVVVIGADISDEIEEEFTLVLSNRHEPHFN